MIATLEARRAPLVTAAAAMEQAEGVLVELDSAVTNKGVAARMGALLLKRNVKLGVLLGQWEHSGGSVNQKQFRANVRSTGVDDSDEALDELFRSIDLDGGGTLDLHELQKALERLRDASKEADRRIERLKKAKTEAWQEAKRRQIEVERMSRAEERAAREREVLEQRNAAERAAASQAAADERAAKELEKRRRRAEVEKQRQAKIEQRRAALG